MADKKIGLALSGGGARGLAHLGVLEVLEKEDIPIDMIAGTSAGAIVGAIYALEKDAGETKKLVAGLVAKRFALFTDLTLPKTGFLHGKRFTSMLKSILGNTEFSDLLVPFACVATDIMTGEAVVIKEGPVIDGVRASISIPAIFTASKREGRYLVDGGLVDPVPVNVLRQMGADVIIAANVVPDVMDRLHSDKPAEQVKEPNIFSIMLRTIHIAGYQAVKSSLAGADIVIEPHVTHIGIGDFHKVEECFVLGATATREAVPEIRQKLEKP